MRSFLSSSLHVRRPGIDFSAEVWGCSGWTVDNALDLRNEWGCDGGDDVEGVFLALEWMLCVENNRLDVIDCGLFGFLGSVEMAVDHVDGVFSGWNTAAVELEMDERKVV